MSILFCLWFALFCSPIYCVDHIVLQCWHLWLIITLVRSRTHSQTIFTIYGKFNFTCYNTCPVVHCHSLFPISYCSLWSEVVGHISKAWMATPCSPYLEGLSSKREKMATVIISKSEHQLQCKPIGDVTVFIFIYGLCCIHMYVWLPWLQQVAISFILCCFIFAFSPAEEFQEYFLLTLLPRYLAMFRLTLSMRNGVITL